MRLILQWIVNIGYIIAGILFLPIVVYRMITSKRYLRGWHNRMGFIPKRYGQRPAIWIHAVSVGEVNAVRSLIKKLMQQLPFHEIFVSTTTDTGYDRAVSLYGEDNVFFFPFDFSLSIAKALKRLNPQLIILAELEVWPNLVLQAKKRNIPVILINGRITEKSLERYKIVSGLINRIFNQLDCVMVQDNTYRQRFESLGVEPDKIIITGSLKWDGASSAESIVNQDRLAKALGINMQHPLIVAGSTGDDLEEEAILRAYQQLRSRFSNLQLAIIPRKPERFDHVANIISSRGFYPVRRSQYPDGTQGPSGIISGKTAIVLGDTMGELRKFYALARVVFVGRTLVEMGGSDVMEVAALAKPIVIGQHYDNFKDAVEKLREANAIEIIDKPERLAGVISEILADATKAQTMGENARKVVRENQGATKKTVAKICDILGMEYDETERNIATPKLTS